MNSAPSSAQRDAASAAPTIGPADGRTGNALVFGRTATTPFNPETMRRNALAAWGWREVPNPDYPDAGPKMLHVKARESALAPITLHEARHTCASLLIAAGVNPKALSLIMGHRHHRHDLRYLRLPDARRVGRGARSHGRLPLAAHRLPATAARGVNLEITFATSFATSNGLCRCIWLVQAISFYSGTGTRTPNSCSRGTRVTDYTIPDRTIKDSGRLRQSVSAVFPEPYCGRVRGKLW
jgi:hypothetical protein